MKVKKQDKEEENLEEEIRLIFSTEYILNCFSDGNEMQYIKFFKIPKIEKLINNEEIMYSIKQYLANDLIISQTSRSSFMHRNTLIYRVNKFHKLTGLNLKKFNDSVLFNNMIHIKSFFDTKTKINDIF